MTVKICVTEDKPRVWVIKNASRELLDFLGRTGSFEKIEGKDKTTEWFSKTDKIRVEPFWGDFLYMVGDEEIITKDLPRGALCTID